MWFYFTPTQVKQLRSVLGQVAMKGESSPHLLITANTAEAAAQVLASLDLQARRQNPYRSARVATLEQQRLILVIALIGALFLVVAMAIAA